MEFLCLPFSFLTFAILDKIEKKHNENIFDPEPYNYIFNRSTCFLDGRFVQHDHLHLNYVLTELEKNSLVYIDLLHYTHEFEEKSNKKKDQPVIKMKSALYIAVKAGNFRSVDIILLFQSKIKDMCFDIFADLFPQLLHYKNFSRYISSFNV